MSSFKQNMKRTKIQVTNTQYEIDLYAIFYR